MAPCHSVFILLIITQCGSQQSTTRSPTPSPSEPYIPFVSEDGCSVEFPIINTSFNVCNLKLPNGFGNYPYYEVRDSRYDGIEEAGTYVYHFNIGAPVLSVDSICQNMSTSPDEGYCTDIASTGSCSHPLVPITGPAFAYQIRISNTTANIADDCWRLSNEQGGPPEWELYYIENPVDGVKLIYKNGDFMHDGGCPDNRKFTISFLCENEFLNVPDEEPMYEKETCDYELEIKSIYGCPNECKIYNRQLCNTQGLCGFDYTNMKPRCFCYDHYEEDDCSLYVANENVTAPQKTLPSSAESVVHTFPHQFYDKHTKETVSVNVTYDLSPMALNGGAYEIDDKDGSRPYVYYVGIFQNIDFDTTNIPDSCKNVTDLPCTDIVDGGAGGVANCSSFDDNGRDYTQRAYAFQYNPTSGWCSYLGTSYAWSLYDEVDDAARGVTINYSGGTWCPSRGINRGIRISLVCPDDQEEFTVPNIEEGAYVEEDTEAYCEYSMEIVTTIACPYQCRTSEINALNNKVEYSVCSEHGICVADPNAEFVRCLCDDGWTGVSCDELDTPKPTESPTVSPTGNPTLRPTRYPTLGVVVHNVTREVFETAGGGKTGGFTAIIVILVLVLCVVVVLVYFGYKKFKQREEVLQTQLDEYKVMRNDGEKQDVRMNAQGVSNFATIDEHIENDDRDDDF